MIGPECELRVAPAVGERGRGVQGEGGCSAAFMIPNVFFSEAFTSSQTQTTPLSLNLLSLVSFLSNFVIEPVSEDEASLCTHLLCR